MCLLKGFKCGYTYTLALFCVFSSNMLSNTGIQSSLVETLITSADYFFPDRKFFVEYDNVLKFILLANELIH
jgi:hypothetical protein